MKRLTIIVLCCLLSGCQFWTSSFELPVLIDDIILGPRTTFFITNKQTLYGLGSFGASYVNKPIPIMSDVRNVISTWNTTIVLKKDGTLWEWGSARVFSKEPYEKKDEISKVLDNVKSIWGNESNLVYVLKEDDSLWVIGHNDCRVNPQPYVESGSMFKLTKVLEGVKEVSVQPFSGNAIASTLYGKHYIWGSTTFDSQRQDVLSLFTDHDVTCQSTPLEVSIEFSVNQIVYQDQALLILTKEGDLYGLGSNHYSRLNSSSETMIKTPTKMATNIKRVQSSAFSIYVLSHQHALYRIENERNSPTQGVSAVYLSNILNNVEMISSGVGSTMAITRDGIIYGWGNNEYNQLGHSNVKVISKLTKIGILKP